MLHLTQKSYIQYCSFNLGGYKFVNQEISVFTVSSIYFSSYQISNVEHDEFYLINSTVCVLPRGKANKLAATLH